MGTGKRPPKERIEKSTDVGDWGEKDVRGAYDGPLEIAGEKVDVDSLPPLAPVDGGKGKGKELPAGSP